MKLLGSRSNPRNFFMPSYGTLSELGLATLPVQDYGNYIDNEQNKIKINNPSKILNLSMKIPKIPYYTKKMSDYFKCRYGVLEDGE